ncbi:outer membrane protein assembly factor BamB family protein [Streptomyces sp. enrichment culture]|uniref:outer membrane protein assembly factor BamB family protein n=1 Tax=Streptomyces sp. enrichment culture TaxID=1795815 RepID=UPI003F572DA8
MAPGYGPPQQTPAGAGFPQQQYGYPQYPAQQYPPGGWLPPSPQGPPRKKRTGLIVLLVLAVLVLGGTGFGAWYLFLGSPSNNVLWSVPSPESELGQSALAEARPETRGTWFTDAAVVHAVRDGVKAYDPDSGEQLWATALPGDVNQACVAPEDSTGDIGIVAYGESKACDHLVAYDLTDGKELWHQDLKPGDDTSALDVSVARAGDVVVVTAANKTKAFKASDGSTPWDPGKYATEDCGSGSFVGGEALIRVRSCRVSDFDAPDYGKQWDEVSAVDPATGKARWTYHHEVPEDSVGGELDARNVISTSPLVLLKNASDGEALFSLDDETGKVRSEFSPGKPARFVMTDDSQGASWSEAGVFGDTFVIGVHDEEERSLMVAYDLDSGKQLWKTDAVAYRDFYPLPAAGEDRILAYTASGGSREGGPALVELAAADGAVTTLVEYPEDISDDMSISARPYWHDDRLYVSAVGAPMTFAGEKAYGLVALSTTD